MVRASVAPRQLECFDLFVHSVCVSLCSGVIAGMQSGMQQELRRHCETEDAAAGNKLFQGTLIGIMSPGASVLQVGGTAQASSCKLVVVAVAALVSFGSNLVNVAQVLGFTLINSTVALAGYYAAAFTVDKAWMGRRRMQV